MRTFFILLISLSTFFVSGQSARKLNKQLQQEFKKLILDYNTKFDRFDSILQLGTNESELFRESASIAYQTQNKLKECQHEALNKYDKLKDLEAIKDIDFSIDSIANYKVHNLQFKEFSESTEKYRVTRLERKKYVSNLESKNLKDQNEEYMLLITELKNDTIVLSTSIQNLFFARQLMYRYGAIFDSMNIVLNNDFLVMEKKLQIINRTYFETELYYRENGPKGFNAYYARYFPNAFPTPKQDGVAHADFGPVNNEVGNEDAYAPPPREEDEVFEIIDVPAEFPGGVQALRKFIQDNMIYPEVAREMGYQGKCYLKFVVSKSGTISNVVVKKGVPDCPECDKEAIRIIRLSPKWKPAENSGLPVNSYYTLPISFKL